MPEADPPEPASSEAAAEPRTVIIGVISAPGTSTELAERIRPDLTERIGARLPSVRWVITGNLRLLLGMLRANRPWRLAIRLSRALVAALAAAVFALVTSDIWRLADGLGPIRLALLTVGSVAGVVLTIVLGAGLWERPPRTGSAREQVIMFNLVTLATVVIGVLALYGTLLVLNLVGAFLLVPRQSLTDALGHKASVASMAGLAWLATSVATVGGALGAGLETDEAVREAAYSYQADAELSR